MITRCLALVTISAVLLSACKEKTSPPPPPAASTAPAAPPPAAAGPLYWSTITGVAQKEAAGVSFRLARLIDVWQQGAMQEISIKFEAPGTVTDGQGHSAAITPAEWKGLADLLKQTPGGKSATRALPAAAHNYADGLGKAKRHAYTFRLLNDSEMMFELVKPLEDESNG